jgi:hypothetical protein
VSVQPWAELCIRNQQVILLCVSLVLPTVAAMSNAWPLACWDCGFESPRGHGYLFFVTVVLLQVESSASGRSLVQGSSTDCEGVFVSDHMQQ